MKRHIVFTILCGVFLLTTLASAAELPERFQGRIASMGPAAGATAYITFNIDELTTTEEVQRLAAALVEGGQDALLKAISDLKPVGWVKIGNGLRYHLRVIRSYDTPEGRVIRGLTDRPIQFGEIVRNSRRSLKYSLGIIELKLDKEGKGSGVLTPTAKMSINGEGRLEVEIFGIQPLRLMGMKAVKAKKKKD